MPENPLDRLYAPTVSFENMHIGETAKADGYFLLVAKPNDSSPNSATVIVSGELVLLNWNVVWKTVVQLDDGTQVVSLQEVVESGGTLSRPLFRPTGCFFVSHKYLPNCISLMEFEIKS